MGSLIDLTGQYFGRWRVIKKDYEETKKHNHGVYWLCECSCSNHTQKSIRSDILRSNQSKSCGCLNNELRSQRFINMNNKKRKDISGNKYGFLTVLKLSDKKILKDNVYGSVSVIVEIYIMLLLQIYRIIKFNLVDV